MAELGVGIVALLMLVVPCLLYLRRRKADGWNTFAEEHNNFAEPVRNAAQKPLALSEWVVAPLLLLSVGGFWLGIPAFRTINYIERGNENSTGPRMPKAIRWYEKALRLDPGSSLAHHGLGNVFMAQGRNEEALHQYQSAIAAEPESAIYHRDLGVLWMKYGNSDEALLEYYRAAALDPLDSDIHREFGTLLFAAGKLEEAARQYRIAILNSSSTLDLHYDLGNALYMQGKTDAAISEYEFVIRLSPESARAHNNYGVLLYGLKRYPAALLSFQKAADLDAHYPDALYNVGRAAQRTGNVKRATAAYRAFLRLAEDNPQYEQPTSEARTQILMLSSKLPPTKSDHLRQEQFAPPLPNAQGASSKRPLSRL